MTASLVLAASLFTAASAGATDTLSVIHDFTGADGNDPNSLIQASDGNFYGTTYLPRSIVFKLTPSGQFTVLYTAPSGGYYGGVVEGPDGFLYVATGDIFRISKSGTGYKVIDNSGAGLYGFSLASDGNFYGSDSNGIFRLTTNGTYTLLSSVSSNGFYVESFSKQATDGNFYGVCYSSWWHVCQVTTSGQVTPIFEYATGTNGRVPATPFILTQGSDGLLYGVAAGGPGDVAFQEIFQLSTSGSYSELYQLGRCTPKTGCSMVIQASDGNLWIADPPQDSIYSITTTGTLLQTISFSSQPNRASHYPQRLVQASSGILFGTTGEPNPAYGAVGSVFSLDAGLPPPK